MSAREAREPMEVSGGIVNANANAHADADVHVHANRKSALIAMSGGVDSAVAALLMQRDGFDCAGALMKLHHNVADGEPDAKTACDRLHISLYTFDFAQTFTEHVIKPFVTAYREGRTPNPCVDCNRQLKFGRLLEATRELGRDCLATGHYARLEHAPGGRFLLLRGSDASKDQSYVLYTLTQERLDHLRFPLGTLTKRQVRELAASAALSNAQKHDSQDICFIPDGDYTGFIAQNTDEPFRKGRFIDIDGNDLGEHRGIAHYTIGQRRGLGLAMPYPPYVLDIRPGKNTVVVGRDEQLYSRTLFAYDINLIPVDKLDEPIKATVKIRYRHDAQPATVRQVGEDLLRIDFDEPQRAITKGQAAVIYDGDVVIGGGTIG